MMSYMSYSSGLAQCGNWVDAWLRVGVRWVTVMMPWDTKGCISNDVSQMRKKSAGVNEEGGWRQ